MKKKYTINLNVILCIVLSLVFLTKNTVYAQCDYEPDAPNCPCFRNYGAWNPAGSTIQNVANDTMGTRESCESWVNNGGKPYYQMVLGCNSELLAEAVATIIWSLKPLGISSYYPREAWCSETIAYWHREVGLPYSDGYKTFWHLDWQNHNITALKTWYAVEEFLFPIGRGRWISWSDLDYDNWELGVTIPVPGAYIATRGMSYVNIFNNISMIVWHDTAYSHSQMIDEMWIHFGPDNKIKKISVTLYQGNIGTPDKVMGGSFEDKDLLSITPSGEEWIGEDWKIYGFGIDLNFARQPVYDCSKLHYVWPANIKPPTVTLIANEQDLEGQSWDKKTRKLKSYARTVSKKNGPKIEAAITSNGPGKPGKERLQEILNRNIQGIPGNNVDWRLPLELSAYDFEIKIDLLDVHPLPIKGIVLDWDLCRIPIGYKVMFADADKKYYEATVPVIRLPSKYYDAHLTFPVPIRFGKSESGMRVRYVKLIFPSGSLHDTAILHGLRFRYDYGPDTDAKFNPVKVKPRKKEWFSVRITDAHFTKRYMSLSGKNKNPLTVIFKICSDDNTYMALSLKNKKDTSCFYRLLSYRGYARLLINKNGLIKKWTATPNTACR